VCTLHLGTLERGSSKVYTLREPGRGLQDGAIEVAARQTIRRELLLECGAGEIGPREVRGAAAGDILEDSCFETRAAEVNSAQISEAKCVSIEDCLIEIGGSQLIVAVSRIADAAPANVV
jgi:hypothetical protein